MSNLTSVIAKTCLIGFVAGTVALVVGVLMQSMSPILVFVGPAIYTITAIRAFHLLLTH